MTEVPPGGPLGAGLGAQGEPMGLWRISHGGIGLEFRVWGLGCPETI